MRTGSRQILLIAGAIILTVVLYFAPKKLEKEEKKETPDSLFSFESIKAEAKKQLKRQEAERINQTETALEKDPSSIGLNDSLGKLWDRLNMPQVSSHYYEAIAQKNPDEKSWISAAYRFYDAFKMAGDSTLRKYYVEKAISSYQRVVDLNPENLDAKTDLGLCYAEGTNAPMQGIMLLREVVAKNPRHEMAQYNLAVLSVKSGQYDKAVERFQKVLEINPSNKEARYLMGRTFASMGKKDEALKNLEMIKGMGDTRFNEEVNILINQINNN